MGQDRTGREGNGRDRMRWRGNNLERKYSDIPRLHEHFNGQIQIRLRKLLLKYRAFHITVLHNNVTHPIQTGNRMQSSPCIYPVQ